MRKLLMLIRFSLFVSVMLTMPAMAQTTIFRVNAGGNDYTDTQGNYWHADQAYTPGSWGYVGGQLYTTPDEIQNTEDDLLYQNTRFWLDAYRFDLPNGDYEVTLKLAEVWYQYPRTRLFHVKIEGDYVLEYFDMYSQVGHDYAIDLTFPAHVVDNRLDVDFEHYEPYAHAMICAIEVIPEGLATPQLFIDPATVYFGANSTTRTFNISNPGRGVLNWEVTPDPAATWIRTLTPASGSLAADAFATVTVVVNREGLAAGDYSGNLQVISNAGTQLVAVEMSVNPTSNYVQRVNCGSRSNFTDDTGRLWEADQAYATGGWGYVTGQSYATSHPISNTTLDVLYQVVQWAPNLQYQFDVPNGSYQVTLHFVEIYFSQIGARIFDVNLEGNLILDNFDLYREVGHDAASTKSYQVTVRDGRLDIGMPASVDAANIAAIEVVSASSTPVLAVTPANLDFGASQTRQNLTLTNTGDGNLNWSMAENPAEGWITGLNPSSGTLAGGTTATVVVDVTREGLTDGSYTGNLQVISNGGNRDVSVALLVTSTQNYMQRVNCGSTTSYTDPDGHLWEADRVYSAGTWGYLAGQTFATTHPIGNTTLDVLYQTVSWAPNLRYQFAVPNATYQVTLHFVEIYYSRVGARIFDVNLEGNLVLDNYDIYREVGHDVAATKGFQVTVLDGRLDLEMSSSVDAANIAAIEVVSVSSAPVLAVTPASLDFGASQTRLNLTLTNTGDGNLNWSMAENPAEGWITGLNPTSGTLAGGTMATVMVDVTREGLAAGSYTGNLQVISNGGNRDVNVALSVTSTQTYVQRINCGSLTAYTDGSGLVWDKDQAYTTGSWGYVGGATYTVYDPISNTTDYKLFQSVRWGLTSYLFDVNNGQYQVTLYFAEIYFTQSRKRVFNVEIEDQSVLNQYDIFAEVGHDVATQKQFTVNVVDNQLNIDFITDIEDPDLAAIQVTRITNTNTDQYLTENQSEVTPGARPEQFVLHQNYPNPFNLETQIRYELAAPAQVNLAIYNSLGQLYKTLQSGEYQAGIYETNWNGRDDNSFPVASGMYLLKLTITPLNAEFAPLVQTRRLLLVK